MEFLLGIILNFVIQEFLLEILQHLEEIARSNSCMHSQNEFSGKSQEHLKELLNNYYGEISRWCPNETMRESQYKFRKESPKGIYGKNPSRNFWRNPQMELLVESPKESK